MKRRIAIQICGTGSGVGKSMIVSALCRIFLQEGFSVCPFKAQNMSLNSYVVRNGGEMSRSQVVQAQACKIEPTVDMNPILIKPIHDSKAQIIIRGRTYGNMSAIEYMRHKRMLKNIVIESYKRLRDEYELIIIEGAGSPAEINLKSHDIANLQMAQIADARVILVGDIDRGGVFAWLVGTLALLTKKERRRVKGIIINKFRGDKRLLKWAIYLLEKKTGIKVLGVIPFFKDIRIPEEDSLDLIKKCSKGQGLRSDSIEIAAIRLPHISNFTDLDALEDEEDVRLGYISNRYELDRPDVIIIPGTKSTIEDLIWLKNSGIADKILEIINHKRSTILIGICGGYQMLGERIYDHNRIESRKSEITGLGILPIITNFEEEKVLSCLKAKDLNSGLMVTGYEIHHGKTQILDGSRFMFKIIERAGKKVEDFDGVSIDNCRIWGTYIHGVFDEDDFRRDLLNKIRLKKGLRPLLKRKRLNLDKELDRLARLVRENIDMDLLYRIIDHAI